MRECRIWTKSPLMSTASSTLSISLISIERKGGELEMERSHEAKGKKPLLPCRLYRPPLAGSMATPGPKPDRWSNSQMDPSNSRQFPVPILWNSP